VLDGMDQSDRLNNISDKIVTNDLNDAYVDVPLESNNISVEVNDRMAEIDAKVAEMERAQEVDMER
jgi:hypothetical protein